MLHGSEQVYCGVHIPDDLSVRLQSEGLEVELVMRWTRLVFGRQSSPYLAMRMLARALELLIGRSSDEHNPFGWASIELNLPGSLTYDPGKTSFAKYRSNSEPSAELVVYFDDGRVMVSNELVTCQALRQVTAGLQYLGNQDAARKRCKPSQNPGAWAGGIVRTDQGIP